MTPSKYDSVTVGVRDAWDSWLFYHDVTTEEVLQEAVKQSVDAWLDRRGSDLFHAAIVEAVRDQEADVTARVAQTFIGRRTGVLPARCPACGVDAYYIRALDRYLHVAVDPHDTCSQALTRGETANTPTSARTG